MVLVGTHTDGAGIHGYQWIDGDTILDLPDEIADDIVPRFPRIFYRVDEICDSLPSEVEDADKLSEVTLADPPEIEPQNPNQLREALEVSASLKNHSTPRLPRVQAGPKR